MSQSPSPTDPALYERVGIVPPRDDLSSTTTHYQAALYLDLLKRALLNVLYEDVGLYSVQGSTDFVCWF